MSILANLITIIIATFTYKSEVIYISILAFIITACWLTFRIFLEYLNEHKKDIEKRLAANYDKRTDLTQDEKDNNVHKQVADRLELFLDELEKKDLAMHRDLLLTILVLRSTLLDEHPWIHGEKSTFVDKLNHMIKSHPDFEKHKSFYDFFFDKINHQ